MKTFSLPWLQRALPILCALALCSAASHAAPVPQSPNSLTFKAPEKGFVSLGVYNAQGQLSSDTPLP